MTSQQEKIFSEQVNKTLKEMHFQGLKAGTKGILGAVLNMCNEGKTIEDIKEFCENSLNMEGMK